ncbi:uncharacterized protein LAJ45_01399 [Morchella importuna]|uniref:uncharacterized protein n=1 Tax=Morchella importuna TaxID=1174673 RepID=UPI001E8E1419|nr:uncharacterized protein LAJ45_01399 [Morchella importuna]KAH8154868.1 hypothetical protein LAJ45_01399 [Morchella importuna]
MLRSFYPRSSYWLSVRLRSRGQGKTLATFASFVPGCVVAKWRNRRELNDNAATHNWGESRKGTPLPLFNRPFAHSSVITRDV